MRILLLSLMLAASIAQTALADQLLYDADTGKRTILLKDDGSLWSAECAYRVDDLRIGNVLGPFGYLEGDDIIYDRKDMHSIGYRMGNVLYGNDGSVIGYFKLR